MAINLSPFFAIPFVQKPFRSEVDLNKVSTERPVSLKYPVDWSLQDTEYQKINPGATTPYVLTLDIAAGLVSPMREVKSVIVDNADNPLPVIIEAIDTGFQIRVDANTRIQSPLLTTNTAFRIYSGVGRGIFPSTVSRVTNIFFCNVPLAPYVWNYDTASVYQGNSIFFTSIENSNTNIDLTISPAKNYVRQSKRLDVIWSYTDDYASNQNTKYSWSSKVGFLSGSVFTPLLSCYVTIQLGLTRAIASPIFSQEFKTIIPAGSSLILRSTFPDVPSTFVLSSLRFSLSGNVATDL